MTLALCWDVTQRRLIDLRTFRENILAATSRVKQSNKRIVLSLFPGKYQNMKKRRQRGIISLCTFNLDSRWKWMDSYATDSFILRDKTSVTSAVKKIKPAGLKVLTAMFLKIQDFWDVLSTGRCLPVDRT
jgi:hypothetical protein